MADQAINALSTKTAPETSDQLLLVGAGEPQLPISPSKQNSETGKMYVNYNETDLNELYSTIQTISACVCPPNTPNIPEQSTGFAITIKYDSNAQMQIYIAINKKIYIRNSNLEWTKL